MRYRRSALVVVSLLASCSSPGDSGSMGTSESSLAGSWEYCTRTAVSTGVTPVEPEPYVRAMAGSGGGLIFPSDDGVRGREPWVSSGSQGAGTRLLKDINPGAQGSDPAQFVQVGERVFFAATDPVAGRELFVSDGTLAGTRRVADIWPGSVGSFPDELFAYQGLVYFSAGSPNHGRELWRSDGTPSGTVLVADLDPGVEDTSPGSFTLGGDGALYFLAHLRGTFTLLMRFETGFSPTEVYRAPSDPGIDAPLVAVGAKLFFTTGDTHDDAVTLMVSDSGAAPEMVGMFGAVGERAGVGTQLLFSATPEVGSDDMELWRSNGTMAGTVLVEDIRPGPQGSNPGSFTVLGNQLFFAADDGFNGREPWDSDGTAARTRLFGNLQPGGGSSNPEVLTTIEDHFFFRVDILSRGVEPWVSDGVRVTTVALTEPSPGPQSSNPRGFVRAGNDVFFTATNASGVRRLYALPFRPEGTCPP